MYKFKPVDLHKHELNVLLADDDNDDCLLFEEALSEMDFITNLTTVNDGEQLLQKLANLPDQAFDVLFLDLNMPRKNGINCLDAMKINGNLKTLPVVIYSTSYEQDIADQLYNSGAYHYICKPANFNELKNVIQEALMIISNKSILQAPHEKFLLGSLNTKH